MAILGDCEAVHYGVGGARVVGVLYVAQREEPSPTAILIHGIPGSEQNVDIAYRLQAMGWNALIVHLRGSWGSDGDYDMTKQPEDAIAAVNYLLDSPFPVDPARIAMIGYSAGSRAAIVAAHRDQRIGALVTISGVADYEDIMLAPETFTAMSAFLRNANAKTLSAQWSQLAGAENPVRLIGNLNRPTLIVHGDQDTVVPYFMAPALAQAAPNAKFATIEGANHVYTGHRETLVATVTDWLGEWATKA